jgi:hypothetical protein
MDEWSPIQGKQKDKIGRPEVDSFEAVMMREKRTKGFMVGFDFTLDAEREMSRFKSRSGREIIAMRVQDLLEQDPLPQRKPPSSIQTEDVAIAKAGAKQGSPLH